MKIYCDNCHKTVKLRYGDLVKDPLNQDAWTDLCCDECDFIITTISSEVEGRLVFLAKSSGEVLTGKD